MAKLGLSGTAEVEGRVLLVGLTGTSVQALGHRLTLGSEVSDSTTAHLESMAPIGGSGILVTKVDGVTLSFWAIKSGVNTRKLWNHFYHSADAVVLVVAGGSDPGDELDSAWTELTTDDKLLESGSELVVVIDAEGQHVAGTTTLDPSKRVAPVKLTQLGMTHDQMVRVDGTTGEGTEDLLKKLCGIIKERRTGK